MFKVQKLPIFIPTLVYLTFLFSQTVSACGYHGSMAGNLSSMYPGSLLVASAHGQAINKGLIKPSALNTSLLAPVMYGDTVQQLQKFRIMLSANIQKQDKAIQFSLGFIESQLWSRYTVSEGKVKLQIHTQKPDRDELVILTSEPIFKKFLNGSLSQQFLTEHKLLIISGKEQEVLNLQQLFSSI